MHPPFFYCYVGPLTLFRPLPMLHGVQVLRVSRRQKKNDVAKQLKRRESIMVTPEGYDAKHVDLCKIPTSQCMKEFSC